MPKGAKPGKKPMKKAEDSSDDSFDFAKEIAAAVDKLPEHVMATYEEPQTKKPLARMTVGQVEAEKRRLLFVGVGGLLLLLLLMWGWNARAFIGGVFSSSSGASLFPKTKQSIASVFNTISQTPIFTTSSTPTTTEPTTDAALEGSFASLFTTPNPSSTSVTTTPTSSLATTSSAMIR